MILNERGSIKIILLYTYGCHNQKGGNCEEKLPTNFDEDNEFMLKYYYQRRRGKIAFDQSRYMEIHIICNLKVLNFTDHTFENIHVIHC